MANETTQDFLIRFKAIYQGSEAAISAFQKQKQQILEMGKQADMSSKQLDKLSTALDKTLKKSISRTYSKDIFGKEGLVALSGDSAEMLSASIKSQIEKHFGNKVQKILPNIPTEVRPSVETFFGGMDAQKAGQLVVKAEAERNRQLRQLANMQISAKEMDNKRVIDIDKARFMAIRENVMRERQLAKLQILAQEEDVKRTIAKSKTFFGGMNPQSAGQLVAKAEREMQRDFANKARLTRISQGKQGGFFGQLGDEFGKINIAGLAARAAATIPVWFAVRGAIAGISNTVRGVIESFASFETSLADLKVMFADTPQAMSGQMYKSIEMIKEAASNSRVPISELASAFRFLKSSNLDFSQTSAAFPVVTKLMNAFGLSAEQAARAIAGMYNTAKDRFPDMLSDTEKFKQIGDILAYTYVKQDVQMGELIATYSNLAPYIKDTGDSFLELITLAGSLNTMMLRGGKAGTAMGRMIMEMASNVPKLKSAFNIDIDPTQPIKSLEILKGIAKEMKTTGGALSAKQVALIKEVFEVRAGIPVKLFTSNIDEIVNSTEKAIKQVQGYLETIEKLRMDTLESQLQRLKNNLGLLGQEFAESVLFGKSWKEVVKGINESLDKSEARQKAIKDFTDLFNVFRLIKSIGATLIADGMEDYQRIMGERGKIAKDLSESERIFKYRDYTPLSKNQLPEKAMLGYTRAYDEAAANVSEKGEKFREKNKEKIELENREKEKTLKILQGELELERELMKIRGANALDLARQKLNDFEKERNLYTDSNKMLEEEQKRKNDVIIAQEQDIQNRKSRAFEHMLSLQQFFGAKESDILNLRLQRLIAMKNEMSVSEFLNKIEELKLQIIKNQVVERQKELNTVGDIALKMSLTSDISERDKLRRINELRTMDKDKVLTRLEGQGTYDRNLILENIGQFDEKLQAEIRRREAKRWGLKLNPEGMVTEEELKKESLRAIRRYGESIDWKSNEKGFSPKYFNRFGDIKIEIKDLAIKDFKETVTKAFRDFIGKDENINKIFKTIDDKLSRE